MRRTAAMLLASILACSAIVACGDEKEDKGKPTTTTPASAARPSTAACQAVRARARRPVRRVAKPAAELDSDKSYRAVVDTSCGFFSIALDIKRAPKTTASFVSLARQRFFDGLTVHRVVPGFVVQGGDPRGDGSGGPGYKTVEPPPENLRYTRGVVAMAKGQIEDAGTAGSQFFVVTGEVAQLQPEYALLGVVADGLDVVQRIGAIEIDANTQRPVNPVLIRSIRIVESKAKK